MHIKLVREQVYDQVLLVRRQRQLPHSINPFDVIRVVNFVHLDAKLQGTAAGRPSAAKPAGTKCSLRGYYN